MQLKQSACTISSVIHHKPRQSGQVVLEMIASLIMFTMMVSLTTSVSVYLYFQHALVTAAREGARQASLSDELSDAATEDAGIVTVKAYIQNQIFQLTGQQFNDTIATISVIPPSQSPNQTPGEREVSVTIDWKITNPLGISGLLSALGADGSAFSEIPTYATATMRYEE